ncbi:MAG: hypothetical protein A3K10_02460 [Bacteroidetes bacterium RIFCSPLOWO2_12_FULL_31_6]|nr:MAG: hypothetical protein A3K10_02460 [Bacteroidetes bacterium RIFCSPLOWO2_12_FULL_31_6]
MKNFYRLIIIVFSVVPLCVVSQNTIYKCTVYSSKTNQPLQGATIKDLPSNQSKVTDSFGVAYFKESKNFTLEISFVGYENQVLTIDRFYYLQNKKDTITLDFYMLKSSQVLGTVEISETKSEGVLANNKWLYDYELQDGKLWLMFNGNKANRLIAIDSLRDTVISTIISEKIEKLEKVLGAYLFAFSKDSVFSLVKNNYGVAISERFNMEKYLSQIKPVICVNDYAIVKDVNPLTASVKFKMIHLKTKNSFFLSRYMNTAKAEYNISHTYANNAMKEHLESVNKGHMGDVWIDDIKPVRENYHETWDLAFHHLIELPVYLRVLNDSIYIINHDNDSIYVFDNSGNYNRVQTINYRKKNVHNSDIIVDEEQQNVYYKYLIKGVCYLEKIDLNTGTSLNIIRIKKTFPQKIKIKSGLIYFMFNTKGLVDSNNNLYLQPIRN